MIGGNRGSRSSARVPDSGVASPRTCCARLAKSRSEREPRMQSPGDSEPRSEAAVSKHEFARCAYEYRTQQGTYSPCILSQGLACIAVITSSGGEITMFLFRRLSRKQVFWFRLFCCKFVCKIVASMWNHNVITFPMFVIRRLDSELEETTHPWATHASNLMQNKMDVGYHVHFYSDPRRY